MKRSRIFPLLAFLACAIGLRAQAPTATSYIQYNTAPAAGNTSIAATTMVTPTWTGNLRFAAYVTQTALGAGCTGNSTVAVNVIFTDPNAPAAQTVTVDTFTVTTNGTLGNVPGNAKSYLFRAKASAAIQFSTTYTAGAGCTTNPSVKLFPLLEVPPGG